MKAIVRFLLAAALLLPFGTGAQSMPTGPIYVITSPGLGLKSTDIRNIYLGERQFFESTKLIPLDNGSAQASFMSKVLNLNAERYEKLWTKKSFRDGLNPPALLASDREIVDMVLKTPGAVGYVTTAPPAGVQVVQKF